MHFQLNVLLLKFQKMHQDHKFSWQYLELKINVKNKLSSYLLLKWEDVI